LVYPASFEYFAPGTLEEALSLLGERGDSAKVLAGGQSLIPLMKLRFAAPEALVDINGIAGLDHLEEDQGGLRIGGLACETTVHAGVMYYFCGAGCRRRFEADPARYVSEVTAT
jgi:CO/xanthine dehydrogenase FAD-binding subunit